MNKIFSFIILVLIISGCSKDDENNPVNNNNNKFNTASGFMNAKVNGTNWFSNTVEFYKEQSTIYLKGTQNLSGNSNYSSSEINFKIINLNQPGLFGIGENEPGYTYFVKASYVLNSENSDNKIYKAYFEDFSYLDITRIDQFGVEADFIFRAFTGDFSDSVEVTGGRLKIEY